MPKLNGILLRSGPKTINSVKFAKQVNIVITKSLRKAIIVAERLTMFSK